MIGLDLAPMDFAQKKNTGVQSVQEIQKGMPQHIHVIYIYIYTIIHIETRQQWTHGYKNEMQPIQSTSKTNKITTHLLDNL